MRAVLLLLIAVLGVGAGSAGAQPAALPPGVSIDASALNPDRREIETFRSWQARAPLATSGLGLIDKAAALKAP